MSDRNEEQYSIEARSLDVVGVASHNFLVLRDGQGRALAELHGLATDRKTGDFIPIGSDEQKHSLRVWHFAQDKQYAAERGMVANEATFISAGQDHKTMLTAGKEEIMARWNAAVAAKEPLNALDLNYPSGGINIVRDTVNSNSSYRTLSEIMGVPVHDFSWKLEPGLDNRMVDEKTIKTLRTHDYPVLDAPAVKENGRYRSTGNDASPDIDRRTGEAMPQRDARSADHPGHGDYARIRDGLAGTLGQDAGRLEQVASATYRVCAENPLVQRVDYVGVHGGHAVATYAPHGLGREPMFNAAIPLAQAERESADVHMTKANDALALAQQQTQAAPQQQQGLQTGGPSLSIGARTA